MALASNCHGSLADVQSVYAWKAGVPAAYFFSSGAASAGADDQRVRAASQLGANFGLAYQLKNDFESVWEDTKSDLKDPFSDLRERRLTAMMAFALEQPGNASTELNDFFQRSSEPDTRSLRRVRTLLEQCGAKAWLETQISEHVGAALQWVPCAAADSIAEAELRSLIHHFCRLN